MTLTEVYKIGEKNLKENGIPDSDFDSLCLMDYFFHIDRTGLILHGDRQADEDICEKFFEAVKTRLTGMPLQYIVGSWNFMGYDFIVGEGVLIPRDDTEIVVEAAADYLKNIECPIVIDLCSGSGAIAVSLAKMFPKSIVTALEYSEKAVGYLEKNIELNNAANVSVYTGDVTKCSDEFTDESFDLIISNPPYIRTEQIDTLQPELQFEPRMALDGGNDGLFFYRNIIKNWSSKIKPGGMIAFEVGEDQFEAVAETLSENDFENIGFHIDLQGYKRTAEAYKKA